MNKCLGKFFNGVKHFLKQSVTCEILFNVRFCIFLTITALCYSFERYLNGILEQTVFVSGMIQEIPRSIYI